MHIKYKLIAHLVFLGLLFHIGTKTIEANTTPVTPTNIDATIANSQAGDTIQLRSGNYSSLVITKSGITITNYPGEVAVFDGRSTISPRAISPQILIAANNIKISGNLKLLHSPEMGIFITNTSQDIMIEGIEIGNTQGHSIASRGKNVTIKNIYVHDGVLQNESKNMPGGWASCIKGERDSDGLYIISNTVERCYGEAIAATMSTNTNIEKNIIRSSWAVGIYLDNVSNIQVKKNFITCTDSHYWRNPTGSPSIAGHTESYSGWTNRFDNITISNNIAIGCDGFAYWGDQTTPSNTLVVNNTFFNSNSVGAYIEGDGTGITFINNITNNTTNLPQGVVHRNNQIANTNTFISTPDPSNPSTTQLKTNIIGSTTSLSDDFGGNARSNSPSVGAWEYNNTSNQNTKAGDLNYDKIVDILDFNILLKGFNTLYTLFDFNSIVANYSK